MLASDVDWMRKAGGPKAWRTRAHQKWTAKAEIADKIACILFLKDVKDANSFKCLKITMNNDSSRSRGQMLVMFTLALPVLIGAIALGADFAIIYSNKIMLQKAADAAALAGASQLTGVTGSASSVESNVVEYADGYACLNGVNDRNHTSATICPSPPTLPGGFTDKIAFVNVTDTQVSVGITRSVPYFFGKMIGLQSASVAATATATIYPQGGSPSGLFPVGFQCTSPCSLNDLGGSKVTFGQKFVGSIGASGNWQWVDVGQGNGASGLGQVLEYGSTESFSIGQTINSSPGNKGNSGPAKNGLAARLATCSAAKYNQSNGNNSFAGSLYDPCSNGALVGGADGIGGTNANAVPANDPCLVTVPAVDYTGCSGSCSLTIEGFAQVYLEQDSTSTSIDACYVQGSTVSDALGSASATDLGPLAPPVLTN